MNNNVAIYIRVSTLHQADKDSLPMQRKDLTNYCSLILNTEQYEIFEDVGYSGKNTLRPKFQEMMTRIRNGDFTHLLVWKIDRISRNLLDFAGMYKELKELGVTFVSKNEQFDTSTAIGEAMLKIILVFAELERNMTSERVTATMISRASNGQWNGGRIPYGYDYNKDTMEFSLNPVESNVVKVMHDKYESMHSLTSVARYLNDNMIRTRNKNLWSPVGVMLILKSNFYCGDYVYNRTKDGNRQKKKSKDEWITIKEHHPAIVDHLQKNRIIKMLENNCKICKAKNTYVSNKHVHIFASLCYCAYCGKPFGSTISNSGRSWQYSKYDCPTRRKSKLNCSNKSTSDPKLGSFVFNYILNMINLQNNFTSEFTNYDIQKALLHGLTFHDIERISDYSLTATYDMLLDNDTNVLYTNSDDALPDDNRINKLSTLRVKLHEIERAMDRLSNLYLFSESSMSEKEYIIKQNKLQEQYTNISNEIDVDTSSDFQQTLSDAQFIQKASNFILMQELSNKKRINFKWLATTIDKKVLKNFVNEIIESIILKDGKVHEITFKNGLCHSFVWK